MPRRQDAPDRIIRGGPSSRSRRPQDKTIQGQVAGRHPHKEQPGRNKEEELPPPRTGSSRDKWRRAPRTGTSGAEQAAGAAASRTGASRGKRKKTPRIASSGAKQEGEATTPRTQTAGEKGPAAQGKNVQGGTSGRSPRPLDRSGSNTKDHARGEH